MQCDTFYCRCSTFLLQMLRTVELNGWVNVFSILCNFLVFSWIEDDSHHRSGITVTKKLDIWLGGGGGVNLSYYFSLQSVSWPSGYHEDKYYVSMVTNHLWLSRKGRFEMISDIVAIYSILLCYWYQWITDMTILVCLFLVHLVSLADNVTSFWFTWWV
jgi:hypothetical protein